MAVWDMNLYCVIPLCIMTVIHWGLGGPGMCMKPGAPSFIYDTLRSCYHASTLESHSGLHPGRLPAHSLPCINHLLDVHGFRRLGSLRLETSSNAFILPLVRPHVQ